jgi:hypothetical protein
MACGGTAYLFLFLQLLIGNRLLTEQHREGLDIVLQTEQEIQCTAHDICWKIITAIYCALHTGLTGVFLKY